MYGLKTESSFDASHFLTDYHGKCENLHGHRWRVVAYLEVEHLQTEGTCKDMVVDFGEFKTELRALTERLDHHFIVEEGSLAPDTFGVPRARGFRPVHCALPHHGGEPREVVLRRAGRPRAARGPGGGLRDPQQLRYYREQR